VGWACLSRDLWASRLAAPSAKRRLGGIEETKCMHQWAQAQAVGCLPGAGQSPAQHSGSLWIGLPMYQIPACDMTPLLEYQLLEAAVHARTGQLRCVVSRANCGIRATAVLGVPRGPSLSLNMYPRSPSSFVTPSEAGCRNKQPNHCSACSALPSKRIARSVWLLSRCKRVPSLRS